MRIYAVSLTLFIGINCFAIIDSNKVLVIDEIFISRIDFDKDYKDSKPFYIESSMSIESSDSLLKIRYAIIDSTNLGSSWLYIYALQTKNEYLMLHHEEVNAVFIDNNKLIANYQLYSKSNYYDGIFSELTSLIVNQKIYIFDGANINEIIPFETPLINIKSLEESINMAQFEYSERHELEFNSDDYFKRILPFLSNGIYSDTNIYLYLLSSFIFKKNQYVLLIHKQENHNSEMQISLNQIKNDKISDEFIIGEIVLIDNQISYFKKPSFEFQKEQLIINTMDNYGDAQQVIIK